MVRRLLAVLVITTTGLVFVGCGDDDDDEGAAPAAKEDASGEPPNEYCRLALKLREAFKPERYSEDDENVVKKTFSDFVEANNEDLDRWIAVAPPEIKDGVQAGVDAFRKAAEGDLSGIEGLDGNEAIVKVAAYERETCAKKPGNPG